jgi:SAM-dependent methyltransferase
MATISRKINWVSSLKNKEAIEKLGQSLQQFYSSDNSYFSNIDFTVNNWIDTQAYGYKKIVEYAETAAAVCEIGCGKANILKHYPAFCSKYTGLDFSAAMLADNAKKYPGAQFFTFESPEVFPAGNEKFDLVFCVFVLEHVSRPAVFLDECKRILKPGGKLVILCPDFLGRGRMTSQRSGYSEGNAKEKLKKYKFIDAIVTLFDNRVRIPYICKQYAQKAAVEPLFLVNCSPVMFVDKFIPDVDAVYVTYKKEIVAYLKQDFSEIFNDEVLRQLELKRKVIFLQMEKKQPSQV